ncbi:hypothetical protein GCM10027277_57540 [Pseudoduganella ginsengisoli]|uniref:Uncharacterized protein n=1 Tax=Pseudoduganella ginsengisoli TaxID=1462440 RepID=A0A6L6Q9K6_9BURK|nr:hypothetical protein [Pseudoduganella ginsengisoli]MTW05881.1 hypothetical protein [Pseudoduganella ginsengisoli]
MFITHINNNTARIRRSYRDHVPDMAVSAAQAWISNAVCGVRPVPMPWAGPYSGVARIEHGGLHVTLYNDEELPILAIRVALRSRNAALWPSSEMSMHKPPEPWSTTTIVLPGALPEPVDLTIIEDALMWGWKELR